MFDCCCSEVLEASRKCTLFYWFSFFLKPFCVINSQSLFDTKVFEYHAI
jgi:hypothetical protein